MDRTIFFMTAFTGCWIGAAYLFATFGGWRTIHRRYYGGMEDGANRQVVNFVTVRFGRFVTYRSCVQVMVDKKGIALSVTFLFRPWHEPIYIPWGDVQLQEVGDSLLIRLAAVPEVSMAIVDRRAIAAVKRYSGQQEVQYGGEVAVARTPMIRLAVVWIVVALLSGIAISYHDLSKLVILVNRGAMTSARVDGVAPQDHHTLRYSYDVSGRTYSGIATDAGFENPPYEQMAQGSVIQVTYDQTQPGVSIPGLAGPALRSELVTATVFGMLFGGLVTYWLRRQGWLARRHSEPESNV